MTNQEMPKPCHICGGEVHTYFYCKTCSKEGGKCTCKRGESNWIDKIIAIPRQPQLSELEEELLKRIRKMYSDNYDMELMSQAYWIDAGEDSETLVFPEIIRRPKQPVWKFDERPDSVEVYYNDTCKHSIPIETWEAIKNELAAKRAKEVDND